MEKESEIDEDAKGSTNLNNFTHFTKRGILNCLYWKNIPKNQEDKSIETFQSDEGDESLSDSEIDSMLSKDKEGNYSRVIVRNKMSFNEYRKEIFKIYSNELKIKYSDISDQYIINLLIIANLKVLYCVDDISKIKDIQFELEKIF